MSAIAGSLGTGVIAGVSNRRRSDRDVRDRLSAAEAEIKLCRELLEQRESRRKR